MSPLAIRGGHKKCQPALGGLALPCSRESSLCDGAPRILCRSLSGSATTSIAMAGTSVNATIRGCGARKSLPECVVARTVSGPVGRWPDRRGFAYACGYGHGGPTRGTMSKITSQPPCGPYCTRHQALWSPISPVIKPCQRRGPLHVQRTGYDDLQALFLMRLVRLMKMRGRYDGRSPGEESRRRLIEAAFRSTLADCEALGVLGEARALIEAD